MFSVSAIAIVFLIIVPGFLRLPVRPIIFNLPILFALTFIAFYVQPILVSESFLNVPVQHWLYVTQDQKNKALTFLFAYLCFFIAGYAAFTRKVKYSHVAVTHRPVTSGLLIAFFVGISFVYYVLATGGIEQFITNHREAVYKNQWSDTREARQVNLIRMLTGFITMAGAILGGYLYATHEKKKARHRWLYMSLPLPGTLIKIALLSRGVFILYALFWISLTVVSKHRVKRLGIKAILLGLLVVMGIFFGLQARTGGLEGPSVLIVAASGLINGVSAFLDVYALTLDTEGGGWTRIVLELSPVPSFIFNSAYENNLTTLVHGVSAGSSAPMPFIGEIFFNVGWGGLLVAFFQGALAGIVNFNVSQSIGRDRIWWLLLFITTVHTFAYMPHSGLRAATRPFVWVSIIFFTVKFIRIILPKKNRTTSAIAD